MKPNLPETEKLVSTITKKNDYPMQDAICPSQNQIIIK